MNNLGISQLIGKTIVKIDGDKDSSDLRFHCSDGTEYLMHHVQDCCESVSLEDIVGDLNDLINQPIVTAYESNGDDPPLYDNEESFTWTFYTIGTAKNTITLRWYGSSNGYYSERVDFEKIN